MDNVLSLLGQIIIIDLCSATNIAFMLLTRRIQTVYAANKKPTGCHVIMLETELSCISV